MNKDRIIEITPTNVNNNNEVDLLVRITDGWGNRLYRYEFGKIWLKEDGDWWYTKKIGKKSNIHINQIEVIKRLMDRWDDIDGEWEDKIYTILSEKVSYKQPKNRNVSR